MGVKNAESSGSIGEVATYMITELHKIECSAYEILTSVKPSPIPIPVIYGMQLENPPLIIMEDLSGKGCILEAFPVVPLEACYAVIDCLADLHAWSITTDIPWRKHVQNVEGIIGMFMDVMNPSMHSILKSTKEQFPAYLGQVDEDLYEKKLNSQSMMNAQKKFSSSLPVVMLHGDTWLNNIFFTKNQNNEAVTNKILAFVDWQVSLAGCGLNDLSRFVSMCIMSESMRKEHEKEFVRRYYNRFMQKARHRLSKPITFEEVWHTYSEITAYNSLMFVTLAGFAVKHFSSKCDSTNFQSMDVEEIPKRLKSAYDKAVDFFNEFPI